VPHHRQGKHTRRVPRGRLTIPASPGTKELLQSRQQCLGRAQPAKILRTHTTLLCLWHYAPPTAGSPPATGYRLRTKGGKRDPVKRWGLPDRVFFACGACHILAYAFLKTYPGSGFAPLWIRPIEGYTGNHIVVVRGQLAFDYHGYCPSFA